MKRKAVSYKGFRLSKINQPEFSHLKLLFAWLGYFALYVLTERFIPTERCYAVHCALDDKIPFCEVFLLPYVFWYLLIIGSLLYFALYNTDSFKRLMIYIIVTQITATIIYILLPNRQDLRPTVLPRDNFLTRGVAFLYTIDTSTNVCPSLHVGFSLGMASVWLKEKEAPRSIKAFVLVCVILICLSVVFIKQHSVVDIFAALPMCFLAEIVAFHWPFQKTA